MGAGEGVLTQLEKLIIPVARDSPRDSTCMSRLEDRQFEQFQRTGEAGALAKAFDYTAPELWRVAWYLSSGDSHRAEDALQSTFLTAIEKRDSWDSSRPLRPPGAYSGTSAAISATRRAPSGCVAWLDRTSVS